MESKLPTAQQLFAEVQKTPLRALRLPGATTPGTRRGSAGVPDLPMPAPLGWLPRCPSSARALALTFRWPPLWLSQAGVGPALPPPHPDATGMADALPAETLARTTSTVPSSIAAHRPVFRLTFTASPFLPAAISLPAGWRARNDHARPPQSRPA